MTPTGRKGPSATRPGACPSTAGRSLCACRPEDEDRETDERKQCYTGGGGRAGW